MTIKVDAYDMVLRFPRLFPDPVLFEDQKNLARRYLSASGVLVEKARYIFGITDEIVATDDRGAPAATAGTAKYLFEGRTIMAEYMSDANIKIGYVDFGTGLAEEDHSRLWSKGKIGELRFELRQFRHNRQSLNIAEIPELYRILTGQATPSSLSTIELDGVPADLFDPVFAHVDSSLRELAEGDGVELEIYAARNLSFSEKAALERRLTRASTKSTVFVILSRRAATVQQPVQ